MKAAARGIRAGVLPSFIVLGVLSGPPSVERASAALSPEVQCQDVVAQAARNYFRDRFNAVMHCENKKSAGKLPQITNCRPDDPPVTGELNTDQRLQKAEDRLLRRLGNRCTDTLVDNISFGIPCGTVATIAELADCVVNDAHGPNADLLVESVYDTTASILDDELRHCQRTIAKESAKYSRARMTARLKCGKKVLAGKIEGACPERTRLFLGRRLAKFRSKVLARCTDAHVLDTAIDFGFPCESFVDLTFDRDGMTNNNLVPPVERLLRCMAAAAAGDGDLGAETIETLPDAPPFSYGVAAGDATDNSFIAWTRADDPDPVTLLVATDPDFPLTSLVFAASPNPAADNTVKTEATGLAPDTEYYYRFVQNGGISRTGKIRTAPLPSSTDTVRFVWTGDSNAFFKPFTVLEGATHDDPDLWLFIGDTIYGDDERSGTGEAMVRSEYHTKYKENRNDRSLRDIMAAAGTVTMWDDHEVTNDFWGTDPSVQTQMAEGSLAFRDYMPIRENTGDPMQLYRNFQWGQAAEFFLLDCRQYRDAQAYITEPACLSMGEPIVLPAGTCAAEIADPGRTYLGAAQKQWLKDGLLNSTATFKFVMNGPLISSLLFLPYDRWDGYTAERDEIIAFIKSNDIRNVIFLSTDIHAAIVNSQVGNATPPIIRELVSGAIGMDPIFRELPPSISPFVPQLPLLFPTITYFDIDRFNYGLIEATTTQATVTYRDNTGGILKTLVIPAT
jgi:phosphodiesterase/alkaline phosphatase D-like protein